MDVQTRAYMPDPGDVPCRAVGLDLQPDPLSIRICNSQKQ